MILCFSIWTIKLVMTFVPTSLRIFTELTKTLPSRIQFKILSLFTAMFIASLLEALSLLSLVPFTSALTSNSNYPFSSLFSSFTFNPIITTGLFFLAITLLSNIFRLFCLKYTLISTCDIGKHISQSYFSNYIYQPFSNYISSDNRDLPTVINKYLDCTLIFLGNYLQLILSILQISALLLSILLIQPWYSFVSLLLLPAIYVSFIFYFRPILHSNSKDLSINLRERQNIINEVSSAFKELKIYDFASSALKSFQHFDDKVWQIDSKNLYLSSLPKYIVEPLGYLLIFLYVAGSYIARPDSSGILVSLSVLVLAFQKLIPYAQLAFNSWSKTKSNISMVSYILDSINSLKPNYGTAILQKIPINNSSFSNSASHQFSTDLSPSTCLQLNSITLTYPDNTPLIKNFSLEIKHRSNICISGTSGSGKSTLLDSIAGLLVPELGSILLNPNISADPSECPLLSWASYFSYTTQHPYIFSNSLLYNITFSETLSFVDEQYLSNCLTICGLDQFVRSLPNGIFTPFGELGQKVSGGQRQRIGLARAIYRRSPILLADECTSGLDHQLSHHVISNLVASCRDHTIIFVSHDRSLDHYFDDVIALSSLN
jgi:ABC-type bacteriocin/lantibiotic exporter with double-glycine peptidase domain